MEAALIEIGITAGIQVAKTYYTHRKKMIADNREDELLSSRVKKCISQSGDSDRESVSSHSSRFPKGSPGALHSWIKSITPGRHRTALGESHLVDMEHDINPEFYEFVRKLLVFIKNEAICQAENPNSHLLKHKHYQQLLILSLMDQSERDGGATI
jgi:hypothetical protein